MQARTTSNTSSAPGTEASARALPVWISDFWETPLTSMLRRDYREISRNTRVAFVDQRGSTSGGAEDSLHLLLRYLPDDIEPVVVLFEDGSFAQRVRALGIETAIAPLSRRVLKAPRERPTLGAVLAYPSAVLELRSVLRKLEVDAVHTNSVKAHLITGPAARLLGLPVVFHVRDMLEGLGRRALLAMFALCPGARIAVSQRVADWYGVDDTRVIDNPIDLEAFARMPSRTQARAEIGVPSNGEVLIGIVGRINRWKGHDTLLRAVAAMNAQARCALVGEARFRDAAFVEELKAMAGNLGLRDRVDFVPWLDDARVAYAALDVHCNCSLREPSGRNIMEASAAGVPSVAFDDGGASELIVDGSSGFVVPAGDEAAFSRALATLVADEPKRVAMGAAAKAGVQRFDPHLHAARVAAILREAAATPP